MGKRHKESEARLEEKEDEEISKEYGHRADLPEEQWLTKPPGMSLGEWFFSTRDSKKDNPK